MICSSWKRNLNQQSLESLTCTVTSDNKGVCSSLSFIFIPCSCTKSLQWQLIIPHKEKIKKNNQTGKLRHPICKRTCASLSSYAWGGGPVGKNTVVFKNWRSQEKNTEGKKEREGGERGVDGETYRGKRGGVAWEASAESWSQVVIDIKDVTRRNVCERTVGNV